MIALRTPSIATLFLLVGGALLAGCESTQDESARIAAELGPVKKEKGLDIDEESKDVKVLDTTVLSDANGTAVVVSVENESDQDLLDVPIGIDVLDAKGKSVYKNDSPGLQEGLTSIPLLKAGETLEWVNNQVLPIGEPKKVEVQIGADAETLSEDLPDVEVQDPKLEKDPVSGINAAGVALNNTTEQQALLIYGVAREGDEIVAAGRALLEKIAPEKQRVYHVYFIGNPEGAQIDVTSFPTVSPTDSEGGSNG